jgi:two-component system, NtrC family, nitrogen regulation sensor histidine kinase NtrY
MGFNRYQFNILIRLILIVVNCYAITFVFALQAYYWTLINLVLLIVLQVFLLFRFLTRWQQDLRVFANSVKHGDYTITYNLVEKTDVHFELYEMLNAVTRYVRTLKIQSEQQNQYFQYVVENAQVGLLAYDNDEKIQLINNEAIKLTGVSDLKNLLELKRVDRIMYDHLHTLGLNQPRLVVSERDRTVKLSARLSKFVMEGRDVFLLSLINIRPELQENELQSWQELISVLTHEIMNSITPIHSLNGSMSKYLDRVEGNEEIIRKAKSNLDVINRRSQSLMNFVDRYRKISTVPLPQKQPASIRQLIEEVLALMAEDLRGIQVDSKIEDKIIGVDRSQIEQVIINVIKNAVAALEQSTRKSIFISTTKKQSEVNIHIQDSGKGIPVEIVDKIFIPFFTTRKGGSGIGLTLSRQIMHRHGGRIEVSNGAVGGTLVTLVFPFG